MTKRTLLAPVLLLSTLCLVPAWAGCDDGDDGGGDDDDGGEGEGEAACTDAPSEDAGDRDAPAEITLPFCGQVALAADDDEDCFRATVANDVLVQVLFDDIEHPISVDAYNGPYLSTGFTRTGHTIQADQGDITVCVTADPGEAPVAALLVIEAPVADVDAAVDNQDGSFTFSFDAPGDEDCAALTVPGLSHVIVTGNDCSGETDFDVVFNGDGEFDFGSFVPAAGQSCGLALLGASADGSLCIQDYGATRTLGALTFAVSFLDDDHGSGAVASTEVTLPFSGTADIEIDGDNDCFAFTLGSAEDIAYAVTGQASDDDVYVSMTWDGGEVFEDPSGTAVGVNGTVDFCVQGYVSDATLSVSLAVAP